MFTGIIQSVGQVLNIQMLQHDCRMKIDRGKNSNDAVNIGDSIAVNGVCLTAVEIEHRTFVADLSNETLSRTTAQHWTSGTNVNIELALTPTTRMGGHLVSGHVDGVGEVVKRWTDGRSERFLIAAPSNIARYIAQKGSICVDGISLTVNSVEGSTFSINIVPHTLQQTIMGSYRAGHKVNLEVDLIARYLERLLMGNTSMIERPTGTDANSNTLSIDFLKQHGFVKD